MFLRLAKVQPHVSYKNVFYKSKLLIQAFNPSIND